MMVGNSHTVLTFLILSGLLHISSSQCGELVSNDSDTAKAVNSVPCVYAQVMGTEVIDEDTEPPQAAIEKSGTVVPTQKIETEAPEVVTEAPEVVTEKAKTKTETPVVTENTETEAPIVTEETESEAPLVDFEVTGSDNPVVTKTEETEAPVVTEKAKTEAPEVVTEAPEVVTEKTITEATEVVTEKVKTKAPVVTEKAETEAPIVTEYAGTEAPVVDFEKTGSEKPVVTKTAETEGPVVTEKAETEAPEVVTKAPQDVTEKTITEAAEVVTEKAKTKAPVVTEKAETEAPTVTEYPGTEAPVVDFEKTGSEKPVVTNKAETEAPSEKAETEAPIVTERAATEAPRVDFHKTEGATSESSTDDTPVDCGAGQCGLLVCSAEECWCEVDGVVIPGTRRDISTSNVVVKCGFLRKSTECLREQARLSYVSCDKRGRYQSSQCHPQGYCFCVTKFGEEIPGTRTDSKVSCAYLEIPGVEDQNEVTGLCREAQARQLTSYSEEKYIAQCDRQGGYVEEQCDGEECWCVDSIGARLPDTYRSRWGQDYSYNPCRARLLSSQCQSPMVWREGTSVCSSTCSEPAPECQGLVTRCSCPLSLPILYNDTCVSILDCRDSSNGEDCGEMVWDDCGCQRSCPNRDIACTTCTPSCVCPPDTPYLHHGFCVAESDCPELTARDCVNGTVYTECAEECPPTCTDPFPSCEGECKEGCQCPSRIPLLHNGVCIPGNECPGEDLTLCQRNRNDILFGDDQFALPSRCDENGAYLPLQCSWDECWCVTPLGTRVATVPYSLVDSVCTEIDYKVGSECNATHCWCTDRRGKTPQSTIRLMHAGISCRESDVDKSVVMVTKCQRERADRCFGIDLVLEVLSPADSCVLPSCTPDGYYRTVQCDGILCWCVEERGNKVPGTDRDRRAGLECTTDGVPTTRCETLRDMGRVMECDALGVPLPRVCDDSSCWCINSEGVEISGTRGDLNISCPERPDACIKERDDRARATENIWGLPLLGPQYPQCDVMGNYRAKQCHDGVCSCVDPNTGARSPDDTSCLTDLAITLYSSYVDENVQIYPRLQLALATACSSRQELITLSLTDRKVHINLPLCSSDGLYFPQQLGSHVSEWWCVDPVSGDEIPGTRGPRHSLPCHGAGLGQALFNSVKLPGCVHDEVMRLAGASTGYQLTCENYTYTPVQCLDERCFCVTVDSGIPLSSAYLHRSDISCGEVEETPCIRERYRACIAKDTHLLAACPQHSPQCDAETGNFLPLQCSQSSCYCVNTITGKEIPYSHGRVGGFKCSQDGRMVEETRSSCHIQQDRGCDVMFHDSPDTEECHLLVCDGELYNDKQCNGDQKKKKNGDQCYCADPQTGEPISYAELDEEFVCGPEGDIQYSNLTDCQVEELRLCPSVYYPQIDAYLRPLSCPLPRCNPDGSYYTERCEDGECNCVNRDTGEVIISTDHLHGQQVCSEEGELIEDTRTPCEKDRSRVCEPQLLDEDLVIPPDCPALPCTHIGLYSPLQCTDSECYCVNVTSGTEYPGTRSPDIGSFDCDYAGIVFLVEEGNEGKCGEQDVLECDDDGEWFLRQQCDADYCYCVYLDSGEIVVGTEQVVGLPDCPALVDTRTRCRVEHDRSCVKEFQGGELVGECGAARCYQDGTYLPQRCEEDSCFCVHRETGEVVDDTEFEAGTHYCNEASETVYLPPCKRQDVLTCTMEGLYASRQCNGAETCWCVYSDTGERVLGVQNVECQVRNDTRGPCQKERDSLCGVSQECSALTCDEMGYFSTIQCLRGDVCFCVEKETGTLTSSAVEVDSDVTCNSDGELVSYSACTEHDLLECDEAGTFVPLQCDNNGTCFCLFGVDDDGECLDDSRTHCQRRRGYLCGTSSSCSVQCDSQGRYGNYDCINNLERCVSESFFKPHYCSGNVCYCVDIHSGDVIFDTLAQGKNFFCSLQGEKRNKTLCQEQSLYSCDQSGYFNSKQEVDGKLDCVYIDTGESNYYDTDCQPAFDLRMECLKVRDRRCPHILNGTSYVPDPHCETVKCDPETGLFLSKQCVRGSCYCVEVEGGVLGGRPPSPETEFYCTDDGELVVLTPCRKQNKLDCSRDGQFAPEQFVGGVHFCAYSDTGNVIQDSKSSEADVECSSVNDTRSHCEKLRDEVCPTYMRDNGNYGRPAPGECSALQCVISTGLYTTKQCRGNGCFCVNPNTGTITSDTAPDKTFRCDEDGVLIQLTACQQQDVLECTSEGEFEAKQCFPDCYCVYSDTGVLVHNSGLANEVECQQVLDQRTHCQLAFDKKCPPELQRGEMLRPGDCPALSCTGDGEYNTIHCIERNCFCVNVNTGELIEDTKGPSDTFICNKEGEKLPLTTCRRQTAYSCDSRGNFHAFQCDPKGSCTCVFIDTGYERTTEIEWCDSRRDNRTQCQRERDAGCGDEIRNCFLPACEVSGEYEKVQCRGTACYCADPLTGEQTDATTFRPGSHWCDETGNPRPITTCKAQDLYLCDADGNFQPAQCNTRFCFCVYLDTGDVTENTESIYYDEKCPSVRENRNTCQITSYKSCPKSILPGTNSITREEGCEPTTCRSDGNFFPMYCEGETCWCTDVAKGEEIEDTRGTKHSFYCPEQRKRVVYTGCEKRRNDICGLEFDREENNWVMLEECDEYNCDPEDRLYVAKQCLGPALCWCIDRYSGNVVEGSVASNCSLECHSNNTYTLSSCQETTKCLQQEVLECDYTGDFYPYQRIDGVHFCVYMDSGEYVPFSEGARDNCPRVRDNRGNCMIEYHGGCTKTYDPTTHKFQYSPDCLRPNCASDERYVARQCEGDICWCVDQDTGTRLPGTTGVSYQVKCDPYRSERCTAQYQLRCDGSYYKETQCTDRFCYCVYIDTGKLIWGSMTRSIANCTRQYDTRGHCRRAKEEACRTYYFDITGTFGTLPGCEFEKLCDRDGNFRKMECRGGDTCMCTDPRTGDVLRETTGPRGTFTCNERGEKIPIILRDKTKCEVEGIEQCTTEGWYPTPDCSNGVCYCVYADSGAPIYGTEVPGAFPDCDEKFDDRSICRKHNEHECAHDYRNGQIVIPSDCPRVLECWDNGLFAPNQCRSDGMCFCVNVTTGDLLPGSFAPRGKYACDEYGNIEVLPTNPPTACQAQEDLSCDSFGNFLSRQCTNPVCFCVYVDSGRVVDGSYTTILEASAVGCVNDYDIRTECEIQRDEACQPTYNYQTFEFERPDECYSARCRSDGTFRAMQCLSRYQCVCVTPDTGEVVPGSPTPVGELACGQEVCEGEQCSCVDEKGRPMGRVSSPPCFFRVGPMTCPEKRKIQNRMGSRYVVQCDENVPERYKTKQCYVNVECWCVDPFNGTLIEGSLGDPSSVHCIYDPPCVRRQKADIKAAQSYEGFYPVSMYSITQCEDDGEYYPEQCDLRNKECWCVDETGIEIKGTRALPWISDVRCVRINPPKHTQRRPKATIKCPSNLSPVYCTKNDCNRATCPGSPTAKCVQYKCQLCVPVFYDPETYHPVSCLYNKLSCYYAGKYYRHGEELDMGCSVTCYCNKGGLRCRPRCLLRRAPAACTDPVIIGDPLDSCCKIHACRDKSFMNNSISLFDDLKGRRRLRRDLTTQILGLK